MNFQRSREQKWNRVRVSTVYIRTFRRTQIVTFTWRRKSQGLQKKTYPKDPNRDLAKDVLVQSCPERNILVTWFLRITKFSVKKVHRGTIIDMPWWYKTWQHSGYNHTRAKQTSSQETQKNLQWSSLNRRGNHKVIYTDNSLGILASVARNYPGIIVRQHHTDHKTHGIAERAVCRVKEGTSALLLQSGLGNEWWADSMECLLLPSAKYSPGSHLLMGENTLRKAVRNALSTD